MQQELWQQQLETGKALRSCIEGIVDKWAQVMNGKATVKSFTNYLSDQAAAVDVDIEALEAKLAPAPASTPEKNESDEPELSPIELERVNIVAEITSAPVFPQALVDRKWAFQNWDEYSPAQLLAILGIVAPESQGSYPLLVAASLSDID